MSITHPIEHFFPSNPLSTATWLFLSNSTFSVLSKYVLLGQRSSPFLNHSGLSHHVTLTLSLLASKPLLPISAGVLLPCTMLPNILVTHLQYSIHALYDSCITNCFQSSVLLNQNKTVSLSNQYLHEDISICELSAFLTFSIKFTKILADMSSNWGIERPLRGQMRVLNKLA